MRQWLAVGSALVAVAIGYGCNGGKSGPATPVPMTIAVVPKGQTHVFWQTVRAGAEAGGREAGVAIVWSAPQLETDFSGQASIVEDFVNRKVAAIVLAPSHQKSLVPAAERAVAAGIPLIVIDSRLDSELVTSYVATDNTQGGVLAARAMGKALGGKGKVAIVGIAAGAGSGIERETGFQDTIQKEFPGIKVVGLQYTDSDRTKGLTVAEDFLTRYPDLAGLFGSNESSAVGAFRAVENRGLKGKVKVVGFDSSSDLLEGLRDGAIDALVVQNPYRIGFEGVRTAVAAVRKQPVEKRVDTGTVVVTRENIDDPEVAKVLHPPLASPRE
jgi:ribose transport system substrate-binding protein